MMSNTPYNDRNGMNTSNLDYTAYTDESVWEESFESDQKMDSLLQYNKGLLEGFSHFVQKNIPGLIKSYEGALDALEKGKTPNHLENLITIKSNLGIAHYFNNEIDKAIFYNEEAKKLIQGTGRSMDRQLESIQSLYVKVTCNLMVFKMMRKEDQEAKSLAQELMSFLNGIQDQKKRRLFIKETIYILFRLETLSSINREYIEGMKKSAPGANYGCFMLMVGVYFQIKSNALC